MKLSDSQNLDAVCIMLSTGLAFQES